METEALALGRALLAELREVFGAEVWLEGGAGKLKFGPSQKLYRWDLDFIKAHRAQLVLALQEEARGQGAGVDEFRSASGSGLESSPAPG